ncbi:helix-turn-helix domain-containing protein [Cyclobacterium plantarum]|nr:helix-turn-helix domain-containing protein [Cyclobacterium plantarum]
MQYIDDKMSLPQIHIKFMVSLRCKMMVKEELKKLKIRFANIQLGEVELFEPLTVDQHDQLQKNLRKSGLELLDDKKTILINKIKSLIVEMVHYTDEVPKVNYSDYISEKVGYDYTYLSNIFSEVTGITIQQYIIIHKIERVKELLLYDELNLSQIANLLNYSSVAHLSNQFKKITGLTPSYFKAMKRRREINLDDL